jgi:hypothetical protein
LTPHDVEEVLVEQRTSRKPFGQQAIELGLCTPKDLWLAFARQLEEGPREIDLDRVGIDVQAVCAVPPDIAIKYHALPVRLVDGILVVATWADNLESAREGMSRDVAGVTLRFAIARQDDVLRALDICYTDTVC